MALDNSPRLNGTAPLFSKKNLDRFFVQYQRVILLVSFGLITILVGFLLFSFFANQQTKLSTGGLDGCLVFPSEQPLNISVRVAGQNTNLSPDNCFFFSALPSGEFVLQVFIRETQAWEQNIQIISGQAIGLGEIEIIY